MKKFLLLLLSLSFIMLNNVSAEEVRIKYNNLTGIYYNRTIDGKFKSHTVSKFQMGDRIAYCIEPGVEITNNYYDIYTDWSKVNMSDELKSLLEKLGYYGYDYPGHQTNYYYIATQELIWKAVNPNIQVVWTTGVNNTGKVIDISKEKKEIMDLVNKHDLKPSFSGKSFKGEIGSTITLIDENNVLDYYDVSISENHKIVKDGNKLLITLNDKVKDEEIIKLKRKYYDDAPLLIYSKSGSQTLSALRISFEESAEFKIVNEEIPEIVEVPNTVLYSVFPLVGTLFVGLGILCAKIR